MWVNGLNQLISVGFIPEVFDPFKVIVTEKDVRLGDEVSVGVVVECLFDPVDHFHGDIRVLIVVIKWIHAVKSEDHCITAKFDNIVSTIAPRTLNSRIRSYISICRHIFEKDLPQFIVVLLFDLVVRRLVMEHHIVVADGRKYGYRGEGCLERSHSFNHCFSHGLPLGVLNWSALICGHAMFAEVSDEQNSLWHITAISFKLGSRFEHFIQSSEICLSAWLTVVQF